MPVDIFGFTIGRKRPSPNQDPAMEAKEARSFVPPLLDDAGYVDAGGYFGAYLDFDGTLKTEAEFISKYRDMSLHPEVESAVDDICNDSIVFDDDRMPVKMKLANVKISLTKQILKRA